MVEDRAVGLIDRAALVAGTARLRAELAEIHDALAAAGACGEAGEIDIEAAHEEFGRLDLGEQRDTLREAFEHIVVVPRGKGRPRQGEPTWKAELIQTKFAACWSSAA